MEEQKDECQYSTQQVTNRFPGHLPVKLPHRLLLHLRLLSQGVRSHLSLGDITPEVSIDRDREAVVAAGSAVSAGMQFAGRGVHADLCL